jgi:hypothetical protein
MSFGDFMGLVAVLSAMLAAFAIMAGVYKRKLELTAGVTAEKAAQYATRNSELESRIRVLERIATSGANSHDIALQIEALRAPAEVTTQ